MPCGHILTGDINIVRDREVKKFLLKGPKYRPPSKINWETCRENINSAINTYCNKWCKRENADKHALNKFKDKCMTIVDSRIEYYKENYKHLSHNLSLSRIKSKLKELNKIYAFVPADKASNNVVVI